MDYEGPEGRIGRRTWGEPQPSVADCAEYRLSLGTPCFAALKVIVSADTDTSTREFVQQALRRWACPQRSADIQRVARELVSHASQHALTGNQHAWLSLALVQGQITCAVQDPSSEPPCPRNLSLARALSDAVGFTPSRAGKTVWTRFLL